jgi:hypothetical protein
MPMSQKGMDRLQILTIAPHKRFPQQVEVEVRAGEVLHCGTFCVETVHLATYTAGKYIATWIQYISRKQIHVAGQENTTSTGGPHHTPDQDDPSKHDSGHRGSVGVQTEVARVLHEDHHKVGNNHEVVGVKGNGEGGSEGGRCCHVRQESQQDSPHHHPMGRRPVHATLQIHMVRSMVVHTVP